MRVSRLVLALVCAGASVSCGSASSDSPAGPTGQPLEILSITPPHGFINEYTGVRISGHGFKTGATVTFGGSLALNVRVIGGSELNAATPLSGIGEADVVVTNPDGETARVARGFAFVSRPPPTITRLDANTAATAGGTAIEIAGNDFLTGVTVTFDGLAGKIYFADARSLYVTVPRHDAGAVDVVVTNPDGQTAVLAGGFTYGHPTMTDFNGQWSGNIALERGEIGFTIENDRLVFVSCGGITQAFVPAPSTAAGEFAAVENGRVLITGAIAGKDYAEGVISTDACPTVDFWASRVGAMPASRRSKR
ncbi:MAG TPA: IPT/TIG domain-containing protein [Vicinamibacterales bacterium]|nr:IPT/TIG domain-containing protein [Vicinamibacterales bacterium]